MVWGGLISGVGSAVGSAVGSVISGAVSKSQMDNQFEMQKRDQDFQREMWQKTNEYNSPKNQARLMAQGGFSPSALFGQNGSSISQAQQTSGGSHGYTPVMPEAISNPFLGITSIAQAMSSLANAKKQGAETTTIQQMLEHQLRGIQLDNNMKELNNALITAYGDKKASAEVGKLVAEIANLSSQTQFTDEKAKSETIKQIGYGIDNLIKNVEHDLKGEELRKIRTFLQTYGQRLVAEIKNIESDTSKNYSEGRYYSASAEEKETFNKFYKDPRFKHSFMNQVVEQGRKAVSERLISDRQAKQVEYLVEQAAYATDMQEFTYWSNQVQGFIHSLGEGVSAFYGAGALKELMKLRQMEQKKPSLFDGRGYYMGNDGGLYQRP